MKNPNTNPVDTAIERLTSLAATINRSAAIVDAVRNELISDLGRNPMIIDQRLNEIALQKGETASALRETIAAKAQVSDAAAPLIASAEKMQAEAQAWDTANLERCRARVLAGIKPFLGANAVRVIHLAPDVAAEMQFQANHSSNNWVANLIRLSEACDLYSTENPAEQVMRAYRGIVATFDTIKAHTAASREANGNAAA